MKKRYYLAFIAGILILILVLKPQSVPKPLFTKTNVEYGTEISLREEDLFKVEDRSKIDSFSIDTSSLIYLDGKSYPEVGTYSIPISFSFSGNIHDSTIQVVVEDTTKPKFVSSTDTVELISASQIYSGDILRHFDVHDLSPVTLSIVTDHVAPNAPGQYVIDLIACDGFDNQTSFQFELIIIDKHSDVISTPENADFTYVNEILIANKKYPLPKDYAPGEDPIAAENIHLMIDEMISLGFDINTDYSGYRSYERQSELYNNYVKVYGLQEAETFSARPGYSEHQTGLAFDLKQGDGQLVEREEEVKWIAENAHRFGFIVRYPKEKEEITGYIYEPWHLRYLGSEATSVYESGLTLEEYLDISGGDYH